MISPHVFVAFYTLIVNKYCFHIYIQKASHQRTKKLTPFMAEKCNILVHVSDTICSGHVLQPCLLYILIAREPSPAQWCPNAGSLSNPIIVPPSGLCFRDKNVINRNYLEMSWIDLDYCFFEINFCVLTKSINKRKCYSFFHEFT